MKYFLTRHRSALRPGWGGGGTLPYMGYIVCAAVKGMVFKQFTLG